MVEDTVRRFWAKVDRNGPVVRPELGACWVWTGQLNDNGYGRFRVDGVATRAHRVGFLLLNGRWPEPFGLHRCDNPPCVRPDHIFEGDALANSSDMAAKLRSTVGERNASAKLTDEQAREIVAMARSGTGRCRIARAFGVSETCVNRIVRGGTWSHATGVNPDEHVPNVRPGAKLTEDQVRSIRRLVSSGIPQKDVARAFGMSPANVCAIVARKQWRDLDD